MAMAQSALVWGRQRKHSVRAGSTVTGTAALTKRYLASVKSQLIQIGDELAANVLPETCVESASQTIENLHAFVRDPLNQSLSTKILAQNSEAIAKIRAHYGRYVVALETCRAQNCSTDNSELVKEYVDNNAGFAFGEAELAHVSSQSKMIFIGSGPFPISALTYAKCYSCQIDALDCDGDAVRISRNLVDSLDDFRGKVEIICADATSFNFAGYSHIAIAAMALPKDRIMAQIKATADRDVVVICRCADGLAQLVYEHVEYSCFAGFKKIGNYIGAPGNFVHAKILKLAT